MKVLKDRLEDIITLMAELANGNFDYQLEISEAGDEMDAIIAGISMLGQELKNSTVSRDFMQSIYHGVVDMLLVLNTDYTIRNVHQAFEELTGYREEDLLGVHISELFHLKENSNLNDILDKFERNEKCLNQELWLYSHYGRVIPTSCSFSFLINNKKEKDGVLIIAKDITQIKQKELELKDAKERAEAANEAKSNFLSSMSHEIRTPLFGIMGFTQLLKTTPLNEEQEQYLNLIKTSGSTLTKLLNDILDLHRIEQDKISIESIPFDLRATIASHLEPYRFLAEDKGVSFFYSFDADIPRIVVGDPTRLNQVLVNLISNATKFTELGSIKMHCSLSSLNEQDQELMLKFTVADTGIGIPQEKQALIFDSFTQSDQSTTRKYGGFGLGLAISKRLVTLMQGEMGIERSCVENETGTTFWFNIKLKYEVDIPVAEEENYLDDNFRITQNNRILVVDDNMINVILMQDVLERMGANVTIAQNGDDAVGLALDHKFDLIFMDIQMPGMDGLEATTQLRKAKIICPIIAFSANAYKDDIAKSLRAGMNDHLCKPFTNHDLIKLLKKWL